MKITIVGAAGGEVTGSAYYVQTRKIQQLHRLNCHLPAMQETIEL